ncbi:unnamed protein product [Bodo saltans]|uniref:Uncharacterized protein n=1 Tax=Bodo saltans TaxID=75058 RepID=A0A0S4IP57_BODSA|nr:unnamed protein product [Bodo saltans]|eukprot:CUE93665.1 unnamed protein product [Bodo saltans]
MDAQEIVMDAFELIVCTAPNDEPVKQHTMLSSPQRSGVRGVGRQQTHQPPTLQCIPVENAVGRSLSEAVQQLSVAPSTITPNLMTSNVGVDGLTHHYAHECFVALKASLDSPPPQHDDFDSNVKPLSLSSSAQLNVDVALHHAASGPFLSSHYSSSMINLAKTNFDGRVLETSVRLAFVFGAKSQLATICL